MAVTSDGKFGIVPVTLKAKDRQCEADANDFPTLARTGLHVCHDTINWLSAILAGLLLPGSSALPTTMTPGVCACHSDV